MQAIRLFMITAMTIAVLLSGRAAPVQAFDCPPDLCMYAYGVCHAFADEACAPWSFNVDWAHCVYDENGCFAYYDCVWTCHPW